MAPAQIWQISKDMRLALLWMEPRSPGTQSFQNGLGHVNQENSFPSAGKAPVCVSDRSSLCVVTAICGAQSKCYTLTLHSPDRVQVLALKKHGFVLHNEVEAMN